MKTLHIINGEIAASKLQQSGVPGEVLPWRDLLLEGPVPTGLSLEEMSRVRARFLSGAIWGRSYEQVLGEFSERDRLLKTFQRSNEVVLWFEHDLAGQLQLLQILHWFARRESSGIGLSLIGVGGSSRGERFQGLSKSSPEQIAALQAGAAEVTVEQLELGRLGWEAFTADTPQRLQNLTEDDLSALPFLRSAIIRHLEQFPATRDGLSRSERQILDSLESQDTRLRAVYEASQIESEEAPFMSDDAFLIQIARLGAGGTPLLRLADGSGLPDRVSPLPEEVWERHLESTEAGRQVLSGRSDLERFQTIDRWLGGVHLHGEHIQWRWAHQRRAIVSQGS